jgi:glycerophosphoryl diester phosphodiesterase
MSDQSASKARLHFARGGSGLLALLVLLTLSGGCDATPPSRSDPSSSSGERTIQLGPRPFYLKDQLPPAALRDRLESCSEGPFRATRFSIGHRGAPLQFPENTRESYVAAARMGAGAIECDVTFTADRKLVCRHSQCDLATTTNILETPLAAKCSERFHPATFELQSEFQSDSDSTNLLQPAGALCCTSDLTLEEFRRLEGRMDAANPRATTAAEYVDATPVWRTDLYSNGGTLMTHSESLELFRELGVAMVPELKAPEVAMPFDGDYSQHAYAKQLLDDYREAGVPPEDVTLQSFDAEDIRFWLGIAPAYGARAIWLVEPSPEIPPPSEAEFAALFEEGFRTIAPPISTLLQLDEDGAIRATEYAKRARAAGLEIVAWTLERSGRIREGRVEGQAKDFYLGPLLPSLVDDGDVFRIIDALVHEVGIRALFSDWPATTTYYANCFGLE